jgi:dihydrofolate reductase
MSQSGASINAAGPRIYLIAAVARNGVIGVDGKLPWSLPEDLQHFKKLIAEKGEPAVLIP